MHCFVPSGVKAVYTVVVEFEFKLVQYADDLTLFVPNIECVKLILQLLDRFTICSGLKVNHTKTEAMWIGSCN